ncbi:MAG: PadR family transcriptional regulator [Psychrobacillus sp.]
MHKTLKNQPKYGYQITKELQNTGIFLIADGAIYPILKTLTAYVDVYTEEHSGRKRNYYSITVFGNKLLDERWNEFEILFEFLMNLKEMN